MRYFHGHPAQSCWLLDAAGLAVLGALLLGRLVAPSTGWHLALLTLAAASATGLFFLWCAVNRGHLQRAASATRRPAVGIQAPTTGDRPSIV